VSNPLPLSLEEPMRFTQPLDHTEARAALRECANNRHQARDWLQRATQQRAEKEKAYRKLRAQKWVGAPEGTAKMREDWVNDQSAQARYERDVAVGVIRAAEERLDEIDGERASLHRLIDWSMKIAPLGEQIERVAA
jgi:hypothetical protein